jgi:hypothetical protein
MREPTFEEVIQSGRVEGYQTCKEGVLGYMAAVEKQAVEDAAKAVIAGDDKRYKFNMAARSVMIELQRAMFEQADDEN